MLTNNASAAVETMRFAYRDDSQDGKATNYSVIGSELVIETDQGREVCCHCDLKTFEMEN